MHLKDFFLHTCHGCINASAVAPKDGEGPTGVSDDGKMDSAFDFSRYISASMDQIIDDVINFSEAPAPSCWEGVGITVCNGRRLG